MVVERSSLPGTSDIVMSSNSRRGITLILDQYS